MTVSPYEHHHHSQFPPASLEFHYRVRTRIRTKLRSVHLWLYRHLSWSRRNLFSSIATIPALPAIPATPRPSVPHTLTATYWPPTGGPITQPLSRISPVPQKTQEQEREREREQERVTQPLLLTASGDFNRAWTQEFHSGKHPSVCTEAALGKLAQQRPFPDIPAWHPAHPEKTLKRIRLVKPSLTLPTTAP